MSRANGWDDVAEFAEEARRLVARNVAEAADADGPLRFDCGPSSRKVPPPGFIHRRLNGPMAIDKR